MFVRVGCHACGSDALAILSLVDEQLGEATASGEDVDATGGPFTDQDVVAVRDMLRTFQGDVRMLFRDAAGRSRQEHEE